MSYLPPSIWAQIEKASKYLPNDAVGFQGRYVALGELRNIIKKSRRSLDQNALLHALFDETIEKGGEALKGWTSDDVKEWALGEHFGWDRFEALGRTRLKPKRRSSSLTKTEMRDFIDWFVAEMAGHGIQLELPGDL